MNMSVPPPQPGTYFVPIDSCDGLTSPAGLPQLGVASAITLTRTAVEPVSVSYTLPTFSLSRELSEAWEGELSSMPCPNGELPVSSASQPAYKLCLHPVGDLISDQFRRRRTWLDCEELPHYAKIIARVRGIQSINVLDIGGNIGTCTMLLASKGHRITVFEPSKRNNRLLEASVALNSYSPNVTLVPGAAGSRARNATLGSDVWAGGANYGNSILDVNRSELLSDGAKWSLENVTVTRIDTHVKEHIHMMKMDCQGHELEALLGAPSLLKVHGVDVIKTEFDPELLRTTGHDPAELLHYLSNRGFRLMQGGFELPKGGYNNFVARASLAKAAGRPAPEIFALNQETIPGEYHRHFI